MVSAREVLKYSIGFIPGPLASCIAVSEKIKGALSHQFQLKNKFWS